MAKEFRPDGHIGYMKALRHNSRQSYTHCLISVPIHHDSHYIVRHPAINQFPNKIVYFRRSNAFDASRNPMNIEPLRLLWFSNISLRAYIHISVPSLFLKPNLLHVVSKNSDIRLIMTFSTTFETILASAIGR